MIKRAFVSVLIFVGLLFAIIYIASATIGIEVWFNRIFFFSMAVVVFASVLVIHYKEWLDLKEIKIWLLFSLLISSAIIGSATLVGLIKFAPRQYISHMGVFFPHWKYENNEIRGELKRIHENGFNAILSDYYTSAYENTSDWLYIRTRVFLKEAKKLDFHVTIRTVTLLCERGDKNRFSEFVKAFEQYIDCFILLCELDTQQFTLAGVPMQNSELLRELEEQADIVRENAPKTPIAITFSLAYGWRATLLYDLITPASKKVDEIGLNIHQDEGAPLTVADLNHLRSVTQKPVFIQELGSSRINQEEQSEYLVRMLNFFKKNGVHKIYIFAWDILMGYGIKNRQAETDVSNWIQENTKWL